MNTLGISVNGNYSVILFDDGTKIRSGNVSKFIPEKPESIDLKITNMCDMNCPFCHERSLTDGEHGDIMNLKFLDTLLPYTELAIGGGNPLAHPQLVEFLELLKSKKLVANMTVHLRHFMNNIELIKWLSKRGLIHGIGVSLATVTSEEIDAIKSVPNTVIHVINGVVDINSMSGMAHRGLKILILGYKNWGRGTSYRFNSFYVHDRMSLMHAYIKTIIRDGWFETISFDNLAIDQLDIRDVLSPEEFNKMYMGDDGQFTMYIDTVNRKFAISSTSPTRFSLTDDIVEMFQVVKRDAKT